MLQANNIVDEIEILRKHITKTDTITKSEILLLLELLFQIQYEYMVFREALG